MAGNKRPRKRKPVKPAIHDALLATGHTPTSGKAVSCAARLPAAGPGLIEKALRSLESAEVSIREGRSLIHVAGKQQNVPALRYINAMRAINVMSSEPCENADVRPKHENCDAAVAAGEDSVTLCWPCYARHVKCGGTP